MSTTQEGSRREKGKNPIEVSLISLTYSNKLERIEDILKKDTSLPLHKMRDIRQYTCNNMLHISCLNNQYNIAKAFINYLEKLNIPKDDLTAWINAQTDEGFTAIHFASFKGNIEMIKLLEQYNADLYVKNKQGLGVMHIGAQGDQPVSLAYFREKGLSLHEKDQKGSTPLHWAAFLGMENATNFLTSWGCNPNEKDHQDGLTPLHLGVISGNSRVVRRLLIKGADKTIKNNEGKLPIDLAKENSYENIIGLLKDGNGFYQCLNIKPSLQKKRSRKSMFGFIFLFFGVMGSNVLFMFPYLHSAIWVLGLTIFGALSFILFLLSWQTNPGYMKNNNKKEILNLLMKNEPQVVCPECIIVKPVRSKHCEYCNCCVAVYDHHCPWINNCVGARNHRYFLGFILSILAALIFVFLVAITHLGNDYVQFLYFPDLFGWDEDFLFTVKEIVAVADLLVSAFFIIPLSALVGVQIMNFVKGKTTSERYGYQPLGHNSMHTSGNPANTNLSTSIEVPPTHTTHLSLIDERPIKRKSPIVETWHNCISMCCSNERDSRYHYQVLS